MELGIQVFVYCGLCVCSYQSKYGVEASPYGLFWCFDLYFYVNVFYVFYPQCLYIVKRSISYNHIHVSI